MRVFLLDPDEIADVRDALDRALREGRGVRVAEDDGLKIKLGHGAWSPSLGVLEVDD